MDFAALFDTSAIRAVNDGVGLPTAGKKSVKIDALASSADWPGREQLCTGKSEWRSSRCPPMRFSHPYGPGIRRVLGENCCSAAGAPASYGAPAIAYCLSVRS